MLKKMNQKQNLIDKIIDSLFGLLNKDNNDESDNNNNKKIKKTLQEKKDINKLILLGK